MTDTTEDIVIVVFFSIPVFIMIGAWLWTYHPFWERWKK